MPQCGLWGGPTGACRTIRPLGLLPVLVQAAAWQGVLLLLLLVVYQDQVQAA
jgi:hypothetical protein